MPSDSPQYAMFSGGRSSLTMVLEMLERGERLDGIIFNNTSLESPQTYKFVAASERYIQDKHGIGLTLLEYIPRKPWHQVVPSVADLKTDGSVFQSMIVKKSFVPTQRFRLCTQNLKVKCTSDFLKRSHDFSDLIRCIGMRSTEMRRIRIGLARNVAHEALACRDYKSLSKKEKEQFRSYTGFLRYPLFEYELSDHDVANRIVALSQELNLDFDITSPGTFLSNCSGCFAKSPVEQEAQFQNHPEARTFWLRNEADRELVKNHPQSNGRQLRNEAFRQHYASLSGKPLDPSVAIGEGYWANHYPIAAVKQMADLYNRLDALPLFADFGCDSGECHID